MITRETAPVGTPIAYVRDGVIEARYAVAGWGAAGRALILDGPLPSQVLYRSADGAFPRLQILTPELERASEAAYIAQGGWRRGLVSEIEWLGEWIYRRREQCWGAEPRVCPPFEEVSGSDLEEARDLLRRAVDLLGGGALDAPRDH